MSTGEITGAQVLGAIKAGVRKVKQKVQGGSGGNDSKFFTTTKKGEIHELRSALRSPNFNQQKDAVKKVIAAMTVGKDVSSLFTDVLNCMQTENIELKKLVYLYIMNNAKSNPELAILAVNTFKKDTRHENALVRALAVRTMGCIRVESVTEYLCEALQKCLTDHNPYVRKTAAICVAKLYDISPDLVEVQGFIDALLELISDPNPTVVANAVAALADIKESSGEEVLDVDTAVLQKLLAALNECTEWGQVFILDSLADYTPQDESEAESIIERVVPRLKHANSAVVLSAVKVIMQYMEVIPSADAIRALCRKMAPPLVSLLCGVGEFPEIQYVALRNINLIVQKRPYILAHEIKVFFCKYNDPIYVKMEKLEIIIRLVDDRKIEQVLLELKEYATEVDVDFVNGLYQFLHESQIGFEQFFFDWYGGAASRARATKSPHANAYASDAFQALEPGFDRFDSIDPEALNHPYFENDQPCTLLIDEIESLWDAIAERDDWSLFEAKLEEIEQMRTALQGAR